MRDNDLEKCVNILRFGESWEKMGAMRELEAIAKECRTRANPVLDLCITPAERERNVPWRAFRRRIGFPLFDLVLDIAQGPAGSDLRDLAADILAHLWHPASVDRLVEDILENEESLCPSQISGIFENLGGIGNEPAAQALMKLWGEGYHYQVVFPLGACRSKAGNAFLIRQARENNDPTLRGYCVLASHLEATDENAAFLLERARNGAMMESSAAIRKICAMNLSSLIPALISIHNSSDDLMIRETIFDALREMRLKSSGSKR